MTLDHIVRIFEAIFKITFLLGLSALIIAIAIFFICLFISLAKDFDKL